MNGSGTRARVHRAGASRIGRIMRTPRRSSAVVLPIAAVLIAALAAGLVAAGAGAARAEPAASSPTPPDPRRWIPGDLHMHVSPPDDPHDVAMSTAEIARAARARGLEFVILTPHLWQAWSPARRRRYARRWRAFADRARAIPGITLIPGVELGVARLGHFGISGVDIDRLGAHPLDAARAAGAFIVVNHPFAVPTGIPGVRASHFDMSYRPWSRGGRGWRDFDGVEVWNLPLSLANVVSRPGGATGEARAFAAADRRARARRRRVTVTGGTDNHRHLVMATTWVLAADAREPSILAALRAGRTCVGGPEAGTLRARGDGDPAGRWARIGGSVHAADHVALRWNGRAELFVDGADRGAHDGGLDVHVDRRVHTFRIVAGASRSGFVYANLDP
jgi:hypothetical protein